MKLTSLTAISPIDGRYFHQLSDLQLLFSEYGLIHHRLIAEVRWFETLAKNIDIKELPELSSNAKRFLQDLIDKFSEKDANRIKLIEMTTRHDVKAVEYFLKEKMASFSDLTKYAEFVHFACTSEDINNLAYGLILHTARKQCLKPVINELISTLQNMAHQYAKIPLLARTHGQPATPTTMGKEIANFAARLKKQAKTIFAVDVMGKFNGAVGNYNAHQTAYPDIDWENVCKQFVTKLGLTFNPYTTQIEPHDYIAELSHAIIRLNSILIDFCRDSWLYISNQYFTLKTDSHAIGSSTMPHKINPIDFENAEGNLGLANALFCFFAEKLPLSRLQRDLTDSTVMRNIGVAFGHTLLAYQSILKGLKKLEPNEKLISKELNQHWEILAETAQTLMRRYGVQEPYEKLKKLTRGKTIKRAGWLKIVDQLELPQHEKIKLKKLTPEKYLGLAVTLAEKI